MPTFSGRRFSHSPRKGFCIWNCQPRERSASTARSGRRETGCLDREEGIGWRWHEGKGKLISSSQNPVRKVPGCLVYTHLCYLDCKTPEGSGPCFSVHTYILALHPAQPRPQTYVCWTEVGRQAGEAWSRLLWTWEYPSQMVKSYPRGYLSHGTATSLSEAKGSTYSKYSASRWENILFSRFRELK